MANDLYSWIDTPKKTSGSALSTTRARDVDIFKDEISENTLNTPFTYIFIALFAGIPVLLANFDANTAAVRLTSFDGSAQFFIILPFIFFTALISTTWFLAYRNHIQRVAAVKRFPWIKNFSALSVALGVAATANLLCMNLKSFSLYWAISLFLLFLGYLSALQVVKRFSLLIQQLKEEVLQVASPEYPFRNQDDDFPLGSAYDGLAADRLDEAYDLRVKELSSITNIASGWHISNTVLAVFMFIYFVFTIFTYFWGWDRSYVQTVNVSSDGQSVKVASLGGQLTYWIEVLSLVYFLVVGVLAASLRSRLNPIVYGDEVKLCNLKSPLDSSPAAQPIAPSSSAPPAAGGSTNNRNAMNFSFSLILQPLLESGRFVQASSAGILLYLVSGDYYYSLSFSLFLIFSFLINDLLDFMSGKDQLCHPERPLPSGRLSSRTSAIASIVTLTAIVIASSQFAAFQQASLLVGLMLSVVYSLSIKRLFPAVGTLVWVLSVMVVFLGVFGHVLSIISYATFALIFYAREILLDIRDADTDEILAKGASVKLLGKKRTQYLYAATLFCFGAIFAALLPTANWLYCFALVGFAVLLLLPLTETGARFVRKISLAVYLGPLFLVGA